MVLGFSIHLKENKLMVALNLWNRLYLLTTIYMYEWHKIPLNIYWEFTINILIVFSAEYSVGC
jgi:hypothetical protein